MAAGPKSDRVEERQQEGVGAGELGSGHGERRRAFMVACLLPSLLGRPRPEGWHGAMLCLPHSPPLPLPRLGWAEPRSQTHKGKNAYPGV